MNIPVSHYAKGYSVQSDRIWSIWSIRQYATFNKSLLFLRIRGVRILAWLRWRTLASQPGPEPGVPNDAA